MLSLAWFEAEKDAIKFLRHRYPPPAAFWTQDQLFRDTREVRIGRDKSLRIQVKRQFISKVHCFLFLMDDRTWAIADNKSTNGTFVDGLRQTSALLEHGSIFILGGEGATFLVFDESQKLTNPTDETAGGQA